MIQRLSHLSLRTSFPDEGDGTACETLGLNSFLTRLMTLSEFTALGISLNEIRFGYHFQRDWRSLYLALGYGNQFNKEVIKFSWNFLQLRIEINSVLRLCLYVSSRVVLKLYLSLVKKKLGA
jgi:hypothetical protein